MSAAVVIRHVLVGKSAMTSVVPAVRIRLGVLPVGQQLPAIGITSVSNVPYNSLGLNSPRRLVRERVQVTAYAQSYPQLDQIMALVGRAISNVYGTVADVDVQAIVPGQVGPDLERMDPQIFMRSRDYLVTYLQ